VNLRHISDTCRFTCQCVSLRWKGGWPPRVWSHGCCSISLSCPGSQHFLLTFPLGPSAVDRHQAALQDMMVAWGSPSAGPAYCHSHLCPILQNASGTKGNRWQWVRPWWTAGMAQVIKHLLSKMSPKFKLRYHPKKIFLNVLRSWKTKKAATDWRLRKHENCVQGEILQSKGREWKNWVCSNLV
jgi:hypothetical protein